MTTRQQRIQELLRPVWHRIRLASTPQPVLDFFMDPNSPEFFERPPEPASPRQYNRIIRRTEDKARKLARKTGEPVYIVNFEGGAGACVWRPPQVR